MLGFTWSCHSPVDHTKNTIYSYYLQNLFMIGIERLNFSQINIFVHVKDTT
jgi:hypothetical protein